MNNIVKLEWECKRCKDQVVSISSNNPITDFCKCGRTSIKLHNNYCFNGFKSLKPKIIQGGSFNLM